MKKLQVITSTLLLSSLLVQPDLLAATSETVVSQPVFYGQPETEALYTEVLNAALNDLNEADAVKAAPVEQTVTEKEKSKLEEEYLAQIPSIKYGKENEEENAVTDLQIDAADMAELTESLIPDETTETEETTEAQIDETLETEKETVLQEKEVKAKTVKKEEEDEELSEKAKEADEDVYLLAQLIYNETGINDHDGMIAVAEVIYNRVKHPTFPDTVKDVIFSPGQFSNTRGLKRKKPTDEMIDVANGVLNENLRIFDNPNVLYFRNPRVTSGISPEKRVDWGSKKYFRCVGNHAFYLGSK